MINQREFRIGNAILHKGVLSNIGHLQNNFFGVYINGIGELEFDQFEPIQLTIKILEKCGFIRDRDGFYQLRLPSGFTIECFATGGIIPSNGAPTKFGFNITVGIGRQSVSPTNFYLHQLQNIYFALTGKELEVNL